MKTKTWALTAMMAMAAGLGMSISTSPAFAANLCTRICQEDYTWCWYSCTPGESWCYDTCRDNYYACISDC